MKWSVIGCLAAQLLAMLWFSSVEYRTYALASDFGGHSQAWVAIAHGHLDPWSSVFRVPFWRNNAEFLFWPLALLYYLYPHPIDLLWVQDAAIVASGLVVVVWVQEVLDRHGGGLSSRARQLVLVGTVAVLIVDPWAYQTIAFDFHMEPFTALLALLTARALWAGRTRQLWWWAPLTLATSGLGGLAVCAVGLSGVAAGRTTRRIGAALAVAGLAWLIGLGALHAVNAGGTLFAAGYGYLAPHHHGPVGISDIVVGLVHHPLRALEIAASRWYLIFGFVAVMGLVGVVWPWALPMVVLVVLPSAVNSNGSYLLPHAAFQTWPALPFVLVGSVAVLVGLARSSGLGRRASRLVVVVWAAALVSVAAIVLPDVPRYWLAVSSPAAATLARVHDDLPGRAEVVVSQGVSGRFSDRPDVYSFYALHEAFPVTRRTVVFVLAPHEGVAPTPPWQTERAVAFARSELHATTALEANGVFELVWHAPAGVKEFSPW